MKSKLTLIVALSAFAGFAHAGAACCPAKANAETETSEKTEAVVQVASVGVSGAVVVASAPDVSAPK